MALSPDGAELCAAHKKVGKVSVVDLRSGKVTSVLSTGPDTNHPAFVTTPSAGYVYDRRGGERHEDLPAPPRQLSSAGRERPLQRG